MCQRCRNNNYVHVKGAIYVAARVGMVPLMVLSRGLWE